MTVDQFIPITLDVVDISADDLTPIRLLTDERNGIIDQVVELWQMNEESHILKVGNLITRINNLNDQIKELECELILKRIGSNDTVDKTKNTK